MSVLISIYQSVGFQSIYLSSPCELHDNPDRITGVDTHEFDDVSMIKLSISLPEFSMSGKLHDNPDRITGADSHEYVEDDQTIYQSLYLSSPCMASSMTIQIGLLE